MFAEPQWTAWHTFADEPRLSAGRRVRTLAGRASDPVEAPADAGAEYRFQNAPAGSFTPRFRSPGVDLRLVAPDGAGWHARRFLVPSSYAGVPVKIVRSADSTAFAMFVPDGGGLAVASTAETIA